MYLVEDYIKICPTCENEFEARRADQEFCSVQHKSEYHNQRARTKRSIFKEVDNYLHRNRDILDRLFFLSEGEKKFSRSYMINAGFKPSFFNGIKTERSTGHKLFLVYDYAFMYDSSTDEIKIYKNE
ncbi:MAG: hypothetical protein IIA45_10585 [Bacteroidetes bacterium]|nr:hypothetical protein [Bacteroidota bacterium]